MIGATGPREPGKRVRAGPPAAPAEDEICRLLDRVRAGDEQAVGELVRLYLPKLRRWARGRLPAHARSMADTEDLVQEVMVQSLRHLARLDYRGEKALQAYIHRTLTNRVRQELRRARRRPRRVELQDQVDTSDPSPLENLAGTELVERYTAALGRLRSKERAVILTRIELGCTYGELARVIGLNSEDAARKAFRRALDRLAEQMRGFET